MPRYFQSPLREQRRWQLQDDMRIIDALIDRMGAEEYSAWARELIKEHGVEGARRQIRKRHMEISASKACPDG